MILLMPAPAAQTAEAAPLPSLNGEWDGALRIAAGMDLQLILHLAEAGSTLESPEQSSRRMPLTVTRDGPKVVIDVPSIGSRLDAMLSADGRTLAGAFTQRGVSSPATFTRRAPGAAAPVAARPQEPKPPFPYRVEEVSVPGTGGLMLGCTLTSPQGPGPHPAVLLIAGSGPQTRDETVLGHKPFLLLADRLTRAGVAVLRCDKRGVGQSQGSFPNASIDDFAADAAAAFAWLRGQPGIDPAHTGLLGHSEGGEVAPMVAATAHSSFLVLIAPPGITGAETLLAQKRVIELADGVPPATVDQSIARQRGLFALALSQDDGATVRTKALAQMAARGATGAQAQMLADGLALPSFRRFLSYDPIPALRALRQPVLVVQGLRDLQVTPADNLPPIRAALAGNAGATFAELPGLNHMLQPATTGAPSEYRGIATTIDEGALKLIVDWVGRQTKRSDG
ncbi:alpha/beta hydrolase [Sphingomonas sp. AP4-R1]|uniref:alpha/beta hydrolase family protein n=1 Tax=Sphingomonas sp. AP4-R1 TaxID=2735134 RepID=UPI0014934379|nr:alpha/beta fold hydrolase [Sphingomonas sp. AP4-R1]QJU58098.1 alpha/beta hydrolase [Sphingomonas sp. AP4-R1]